MCSANVFHFFPCFYCNMEKVKHRNSWQVFHPVPSWIPSVKSLCCPELTFIQVPPNLPNSKLQQHHLQTFHPTASTFNLKFIQLACEWSHKLLTNFSHLNFPPFLSAWSNLNSWQICHYDSFPQTASWEVWRFQHHEEVLEKGNVIFYC